MDALLLRGNGGAQLGSEGRTVQRIGGLVVVALAKVVGDDGFHVEIVRLG